MEGRAFDTVVVYKILKLLSTPIEKSDAFKLGVIDANGKKLKKATTATERNAYSFLNRFVFKVQYALTKSSDFKGRRLLSFAAALALLKEYKEEDDSLEVGSLLELYSLDENVILHSKLLERNMISFRSLIDENSVGGGGIAGIGIGPQGEPGVDPRLMPMATRRKKKKVQSEGVIGGTAGAAIGGSLGGVGGAWKGAKIGSAVGDATAVAATAYSVYKGGKKVKQILDKKKKVK